MLADILATLHRSVHEALSKNSPEGANVALEATEIINIIDTVASNALISAFGNSDCFEECDTIEKCHIIFQNSDDEHDVRAYLAQGPTSLVKTAIRIFTEGRRLSRLPHWKFTEHL